MRRSGIESSSGGKANNGSQAESKAALAQFDTDYYGRVELLRQTGETKLKAGERVPQTSRHER